MPFEFILNVFIEKLNDSIWGKKGRCSLETVHKLQDSRWRCFEHLKVEFGVSQK